MPDDGISDWLQKLHSKDPRPLNGVPDAPAVNALPADWAPSGPSVIEGLRAATETDAAYARLKAQYEASQRFKRELMTAVYTGELTDTQAARAALIRERVMDREGLDLIPEPVPVIDGLLYFDSLAWIAGESGSYKSFVAQDMVARFADPTLDYHGLAMSHGNALIVVGEGNSSYRKRVEAWEEYRAQPWPVSAKFHNGAVQLGDRDTVAALCSIIRDGEYDLVVFDTQAMMTIGVEENSANEMGVIIGALHAMREVRGGCILTVHHHGKTSADMRGSGAIYGAANTVITTTRESSTVTLSTLHKDAGKQKDAQGIEYPPFMLTPCRESLVITAPLTLGDGATRATAAFPPLDRALTLPVLRVLQPMDVFGGSALQLIQWLTEAGYTGDLNKGTVAREINRLVRDGLLAGPKTALKVTRHALDAMEDLRSQAMDTDPGDDD